VAGAKSARIGTDLTQGSIGRTLITFALPLIATNLIQQLYSAVDLAVIGQFTDRIGTIEVAQGSEVADLVTPLAVAFGTAGQIYIAQLTGAGDRTKTRHTVGTLLSWMLLLSVIFVVGTLALRWQILSWLNCPADAVPGAVGYLEITAIAMPAVFIYNGICSILRGMGESKRPLLFIIVAAVVNIFLDLILVAWFKMGAAGTAIATAASQFGSCAAACIYLYRKRDLMDLKFNWDTFRIRWQPLKVILVLGIPRVVQNIAIHFSLMYCTARVNSYGEIASATNSVGNKIQRLCNVFVMGVDGAASTMIGQNLGARKTDRCSKTVWGTLVCTMILATVTSAVGLIFSDTLYGVFTKDPEVVGMGRVYMQIMVATFYCGALMGPFFAMVNGSGFASMGFVIGILDVVFRVGISLLFEMLFHLGVNSYWWGNALARVGPMIICMIYYFSGKWKTRKLLTE
jgi:putative MATE family efflux protein